MYKFKIKVAGLATIDVTIDASDPNQAGAVSYKQDSTIPNLIDSLKQYISEKGGLVSGLDSGSATPADFAHAIATKYKGPNDMALQVEMLETDPKLAKYKLPQLPAGATY